MNTSKILKVIKFILLGIMLIAAFTWVVMSLWNWLMPYLFNAKVITFWQALGILVLCKILFGGWKGGWRGKSCNYQSDWKQKLEQRMAGMSEEERQQFKEQFYKKCNKKWGCDFPDDDKK